MDSFIDNSEESRFLDAMEHIPQDIDNVSDSTCIRNWEYDVWVSTPQSVGERRRKFARWMGLLDGSEGENCLGSCDENKGGIFNGDIDRIMENSGAVLRTSSIEDEFSSSRSSLSSWDTDDLGLSHAVKLSECRNDIRNCNFQSERYADGEIENVLQSSASFGPRENLFSCSTPRTKAKLRNILLSKLRSVTCINGRNVEDDSVGPDQVQGQRMQRVRVRHGKKRSKELSALFTGQDIQAHEGSILTMKFSLDGQYLASAGEDMIVRVWQVVEDERSDMVDIPDADPSCVYFSVNHLSELGPLSAEKDNVKKSKTLRKTADSACIVFPPKVFRILEKPLHEFRGHNGEILDLSWSRDNSLLSSSVDKTVRLWRLGFEQCLKVFSHTDYVTCIHFNPVNDDYFISGSIDGKVRIWSITGCQVVEWSEIRDIITAVSYRPDGQGGIIGSITGTCRFFNVADNHFQLETQMCLSSKKKSPCKRITSFQFLPQDPTKVLVTCADSQVRIIDGMNVIGKYKGFRNTASQISASLTSDGKHIISASEDSNVYMWNYVNQNESLSPPKAIKSFECFTSDSSVAISWSGLKKPVNSEDLLSSRKLDESSTNSLPFLSSNCFSLTQEFLDSNCKGSATWPEEKLPVSNPWGVTSPLGKSQFKLFKSSCLSSSESHSWGLVIVTAGWDGRIRSFCNYGLPVPL